MLKQKQHLELQEAQQTSTKQQTAIDDLEKSIAQLKLDQQDQLAKHSHDTEVLQKSAEEARYAAVQVRIPA